MTSAFPWHIRPQIPGGGDRRYVVQTWRASLRTTREHGDKSLAEFRRDVDDPIDLILDGRDTRVLIAAPNAADAVTIAGWIAWTPITGGNVLHYVYVRGGRHGSARGTGCARRLHQRAMLFSGRLLFTFRGPSADTLLVKYPGAVYVTPRAFLGLD